MTLSTFTSITPIPERSDATPGLWNARFSQVDANFASAQTIMNTNLIPPGLPRTVASVPSYLINNSVFNVKDVDTSIVTDGVTDNTAKMLGVWTTLGAGFEGTIVIPYGVKYNFTSAATMVPLKAIVDDRSGVNAWDTAGQRQRVVGYWERGDPTSVVDLQQIISSGHNACFITDNRGTAGSSSASLGVAMWMWGRGRFTKQAGNEGIRHLGRIEFSKIPGSETRWWWILRRGAPWVAKDYEYWYTAKSYTSGDYILDSTGARFYKATSTGTSGGSNPVHTGGAVSDGGVTWQWVSSAVDDGVFNVTEDGQLSLNASPTVGVLGYFKASAESTQPGTATVYVEGTGVSKTADFRLRPTDGAGAPTSVPFMQADATLGTRFVTSTVAKTLAKMTDANGLELGVHGHFEALASDGSTIPTVGNCGCLVLNNTSMTTITDLANGSPTQEVMVVSNTALSTLVHSSTFRLKGSANVVLSVFSTLVMKKMSLSVAWFEVSRNF